MLEYGKLLWCEDQSDVSMFSRCRFVVGDEEEDEGGGEGVEVRKGSERKTSILAMDLAKWPQT